MLETNKTKRIDSLHYVDPVSGKVVTDVYKTSVVTIYNPFTDPLMVCVTYCPTCGRPAKTYADALAVREIGECLGCDHVRGDVQDQLRAEYATEQYLYDRESEEL